VVGEDRADATVVPEKSALKEKTKPRQPKLRPVPMPTTTFNLKVANAKNALVDAGVAAVGVGGEEGERAVPTSPTRRAVGVEGEGEVGVVTPSRMAPQTVTAMRIERIRMGKWKA
jgi:hypothetical protein